MHPSTYSAFCTFLIMFLHKSCLFRKIHWPNHCPFFPLMKRFFLIPQRRKPISWQYPDSGEAELSLATYFFFYFFFLSSPSPHFLSLSLQMKVSLSTDAEALQLFQPDMSTHWLLSSCSSEHCSHGLCCCSLSAHITAYKGCPCPRVWA